MVRDSDGEYELRDEVTLEEEADTSTNLLESVFLNGTLLKETALNEIREAVKGNK